MSPNAFINKAKPPTSTELAAALGSATAVWDQLLSDLAQEFGVNVREWSSYSRKAGWSLRVKRKERTIVWLAPCRGCFLAAFILGDKAALAAQQARLPKRVLRIISEAPNYLEGTGVRFEAKSSRDIAMLKKLAAIKLAN